jgi:hypothetical protein
MRAGISIVASRRRRVYIIGPSWERLLRFATPVDPRGWQKVPPPGEAEPPTGLASRGSFPSLSACARARTSSARLASPMRWTGVFPPIELFRRFVAPPIAAVMGILFFCVRCSGLAQQLLDFRTASSRFGMIPSDLTSPPCSAMVTAIVSAWTSKPINFTLSIDWLLSLALYCLSSDSQHNPRVANRSRSFHSD